jgi:glycosyltransferase involved in cell wall biosynthesis
MSRNPIKLLLTNDSLPLGGTERLLLQYLEHLDRTKFEVHLMTLTDKGILLPEARKKADHYFCPNRRFGLDLKAIMKLRHYMIEHKIELVHTNQWLDSLYVLMAGKGLPVTKIATIHGYNYTWRHHVNLKVLNYFDRIICVSKSEKLDYFKMGIPWEKISVIHNSFDTNLFHKSSELSRDNEKFLIVMVGSFTWEKDQETLIKAANILKTQGSEFELHLVGKRDYQIFGNCQEFVSQQGLNDIVKFLGQVRVDGDFLSQYDLFVFSSRSETFGIALLEAMACGIPVLVSDIPSSMELIQHGRYGQYFETGNPDSCAAKLSKFISNRDYCIALGRKAYLRARDFRVENTIRNLEGMYADLLER